MYILYIFLGIISTHTTQISPPLFFITHTHKKHTSPRATCCVQKSKMIFLLGFSEYFDIYSGILVSIVIFFFVIG